MAFFQYTRIIAEKRMRVVLNEDFGINQWPALEQFYQEQIKSGQLLWDLDLGRLRFINSMMLGLLIGLNTVLANRGGKLRLLAPQSSRVADLIVLAKIDTIIELTRYETGAEVTSQDKS